MKKQTANTIFVRFSPPTLNRQTLESYFSEVGPVKKCSVIRSRDAEAKGFGFVKFTSQQDADEAARRFQQCKVQGDDGISYNIQVDLASTGKHQSQHNQSDSEPNKNENKVNTTFEDASNKEESNQEYKKLVKQKQTARVIIRNLSFYATKRDLQKAMEAQFGKVLDVSLPTVPGTKSGNRGFGFVTFENAASAKKAVSSDTTIIIKKRPVAIDFSISKVQHKRIQKEEEEEAKEEKLQTNEKEENDEDGSSDEESSSDNDEENSDDDDDDDEEENDDDDDDESSSDNDNSSDSEDESKKSTTVVNNTKHELFLRNIPFDATRHDLFELFRSYGRISGIYILKDRITGIGKGTAFVQFENEGGCRRALEAANSGNNGGTPFVASRNMLESKPSQTEGAMYLNGRRILIDLAVDKSTAETLKVERGEDGKPLEKQSSGKDRRNLYLQMEGRVEGNSSNNVKGDDNTQSENADPDAWENLPEGDKLKRQRAFSEKTTKLRSPLFFINPFRLSIRNLASHVDEAALKTLMVQGIKNGLENGKVDRDDVIAHWKAAGDEGSTNREIMKRIADLELSVRKDDTSNESQNNNLIEGEESDPVIPSFNEGDGIKHYIPSVFIDRDFSAIGKKSTLDSSIKNKKNIAPSRGFGFVEFTHHVHALACLRELNNNSLYSSEFVSGGKKALQMKKQTIKSQLTGKKGRKNRNKGESGKESASSFTGDDGKIRIPRLIVEFTVENKAKAKKQAERRSLQLVNAEKQKLATLLARKKRQENDGGNEEKKPKLSRGARQRKRKRERGDSDKNQESDNQANAVIKAKEAMQDKKRLAQEKITAEKEKMKPIKPLKKKKKVDTEEKAFEDMVRSYKAAFENTEDSTKGSKQKKNEDPLTESQHPRAVVAEKRWYE